MTGAAGGGAASGSGSGSSVRTGSVEALAEQVRDIFTHPKARFVLKYRHADAKLSLRVTDDVKVRGAGGRGTFVSANGDGGGWGLFGMGG